MNTTDRSPSAQNDRPPAACCDSARLNTCCGAADKPACCGMSAAPSACGCVRPSAAGAVYEGTTAAVAAAKGDR
jgi:hypothetical protein